MKKVKKLIILSLLLTSFSLNLNAQSTEFIPQEIIESKFYHFDLVHLEEGYLLVSCIPDSMYNPGLIKPIERSGRTIMQYDPAYRPLVIGGGEWVDDCFNVSRPFEELNDAVWIDFILSFTILNPSEIILNHK